MARGDPHFRLRLPEALKLKVEQAAERNRRSMTGEILFHLDNALGDESQTATGPSPGKASPAAAPINTALPGGPEIHG